MREGEKPFSFIGVEPSYCLSAWSRSVWRIHADSVLCLLSRVALLNALKSARFMRTDNCLHFERFRRTDFRLTMVIPYIGPVGRAP